MRTIRRYSNRKLYDTTEKHYVTLLDLALRVRQGDEIQVRCHVTGKDLTAQTLAQIIWVEEVRGPRYSTELLVEIIRKGIPEVE
jgi:polyhydroxyalkanoate synthesis repressor PhaR